MQKYFVITKAYVFIFLLLLFATSRLAAQQPIKDLQPTVILISFDAFRYDYIDRFHPPELEALAKDGVRAKWMIPSFPTKTLPNHYTIATGLYPGHHGIVANQAYEFGEVFSSDDRRTVADPKWWGGEPIWVTAQKNGMTTASFFFVGSEAPVGGVWPTIHRDYNANVPNTMRVDTALKWLDLPVEKRPRVITLYFSITDDVGHEFGPDSEEIKYAVGEVDDLVKRLMDGLKARKIDKKANVIIVSDHGMANLDYSHAVLFDDHFDLALAERILWTKEIIQIFPKPGNLDLILTKMKAADHVTCWKRENVPSRMHYSEGTRIAPIVCSTEQGWMASSHKNYDDWFRNLSEPTRLRGAHGYDNKYPEMRATFVAHGEAFKRGYVAEPFENVEMYNVMCKILGLKPAKNDGDLKRVKGMLK